MCGRIDLQHYTCRAHQSWARALQRLRGKLDDRGGYEEVNQQHASVQMSAMAGVPQYASQELPKQHSVYDAKVCQTPGLIPQALAGLLVPSGGTVGTPGPLTSPHGIRIGPDKQVNQDYCSVAMASAYTPYRIIAQWPFYPDRSSQRMSLPQGILPSRRRSAMQWTRILTF